MKEKPPPLTDEEIAARLASQRAGIEGDVDYLIGNFTAHMNKDIAGSLLKAIQSSGKPEEGFAAWKNFSKSGDKSGLRAALQGWKVPTGRFFRLINDRQRTTQYQEGRGRSLRVTASRTLSAAFQSVSMQRASRRWAESRPGETNALQEAIFRVFISIQRKYEGPSLLYHPLESVLAPHLKRAVEEKLSSSYAELKKQTGKPLLDENIIRGFRPRVLAGMLAQFDRLAAQSYGAGQKAPMPGYGFKAEQMPGEVKFGIEIEGFASLRQTYPQHLAALADYFRDNGLPAGTALTHTSSAYSDWSFAHDKTIVEPLNYNGRYKADDIIAAKSSSFELISPVLRGADGQAQLIKAADLLKDINFRSNEACGLHMHVSLEETTLDQKKNLVRALYHNEAALDQLVSPERRGEGGQFFHSIRGIDIAAVDRAATIEELVEIINPGKDRNSKFDMTGLVGGLPTLQYRGAGGAAYLDNVTDYAVILGNFTQQALDNPDVKLANVITKLVEQRDAPRQAATKKTSQSPARTKGPGSP